MESINFDRSLENGRKKEVPRCALIVGKKIIKEYRLQLTVNKI